MRNSLQIPYLNLYYDPMLGCIYQFYPQLERRVDRRKGMRSKNPQVGDINSYHKR